MYINVRAYDEICVRACDEIYVRVYIDVINEHTRHIWGIWGGVPGQVDGVYVEKYLRNN